MELLYPILVLLNEKSSKNKKQFKTEDGYRFGPLVLAQRQSKLKDSKKSKVGSGFQRNDSK
mgnify:CR=1 FL=1